MRDARRNHDADIAGEGKLIVKDKVVTLPLRLEITKSNVEQMKF